MAVDFQSHSLFVAQLFRGEEAHKPDPVLGQFSLSQGCGKSLFWACLLATSKNVPEYGPPDERVLRNPPPQNTKRTNK